ncbi:MAG: hypothetical protein R3249_05640 [Nitriliruptorales bacterium]|nr:hypothetical protein [Nitriliruptorales bacterium]
MKYTGFRFGLGMNVTWPLVALTAAMSLALGACGSGEEVAELAAESCDELAEAFAAELETRTFAAIEDDDRDPYYITEDVSEAQLIVLRGLYAIPDKASLGCAEASDFHSSVVAALSDRFKAEVPRWLSSIDVGNTWKQYDDDLRFAIEGAFLPANQP